MYVLKRTFNLIYIIYMSLFSIACFKTGFHNICICVIYKLYSLYNLLIYIYYSSCTVHKPAMQKLVQ